MRFSKITYTLQFLCPRLPRGMDWVSVNFSLFPLLSCLPAWEERILRGQFMLNGGIGTRLARWFSRVYTYKHIHRIRILIYQCNAEADVSAKFRNVNLWTAKNCRDKNMECSLPYLGAPATPSKTLVASIPPFTRLRPRS